jgi:hypothetical protein
MDQFNWLVAEIMVQQRQQQLTSQPPAAPEAHSREAGVRHSLASAIVGLGLRLDRSAGQLVLAHSTEGKR